MYTKETHKTYSAQADGEEIYNGWAVWRGDTLVAVVESELTADKLIEVLSK